MSEQPVPDPTPVDPYAGLTGQDVFDEPDEVRRAVRDRRRPSWADED